MMDNDTFHPIAGTAGRYRIDRRGNAWSLASGKIRKLKPAILPNGYERVVFYFGKRRVPCSVHRLVALAFLPNPQKKPEVNHINGDKSDNALENLEWVTSQENKQHAIDEGLWNPRNPHGVKGEKNHMAKLTAWQVGEIKQLRAAGVLIRELAANYGVSRGAIRGILTGANWKHLSYANK